MSRNSIRARRVCFDAHKRVSEDGEIYLECHGCKIRMHPARTAWEADHIRRYAEGGTDTPDNLFPICVPCHRTKSAADSREIAKGKRNAEKHFGIRRTARPMAGSRRSAWKKHMDGTVSRRDGT